MALSKDAIGKIKSFVQSTKRLLMKEFAAQIQQHYGIRLDGSYLMVEELTTKDGSIIQTARLLRERLSYLESTIAGTNKKEEAVAQLIREQAFTILNRFAAIRMAEERNIIPETIKKGYNSEGFQVFDQLSGGAQTAEQFERYTWFLNAMFDELAIDLPAVFDRFSPYALLYPSEKVMLELLDIIDDEDLNIYREEGQQPINLWEEDETIGWIYQYYNSREEISAMREASGAPRNSRELAVRNQFFTPRYVVQFLVDNSLGRQWFEMTKGQTSLVSDCQYMVKREQEIFLDKGEAIPETKIVDANYIEYRALKDPREILMLDPACGSMHFGLYCFDLFEQIYTEAWDNHPELMPDLRDKYLREDYIKRIPGYILQYNIHGVDIDPRAIQIAGLSLWLRAQKSYKKLGLQPAERPMIKKSNLVVAEPMPGDAALLSEFTRSLPGPIGKLVRVIWDKMQLAGETGLLLKIEDELKKEIEIAKEEYKQYKGGSTQTSIFGGVEDAKAAEMAAIYGKDQKITKDFFDTAEEEVLKALQSFSENAEGEHAFQKLLFAEDTARGFAFIELCRKRYDVIVMNPPFGDASINSEEYFKSNYKNWAKNILTCFFYRCAELINDNGKYGALFDRTVSIKSSYEKFRIDCMIGKISTLLDTGWGVLDANVETTVQILEKKAGVIGLFVDLREMTNKKFNLIDKLNLKEYVKIDSRNFASLPNMIIGYYMKPFVLDLFAKNKNLKQEGFSAMFGSSIPPLPYVRLYWEIVDSSQYKLYYNGGGTFTQFYAPIYELIKFGKHGEKVEHNKSTNLRNVEKAFKRTVGYGKRGEILDAHYLQEDILFSGEGHTFNFTLERSNNKLLELVSFLNSSYSQYILNQYTGQHKSNGYVNLIPYVEGNIDLSFVREIIKMKKKWSSIDETNLDFKNIILGYLEKNSLKSTYEMFSSEFVSDMKELNNLTKQNDLQYINRLDLNEDNKKTIADYSSKRPQDQLVTIKELINNQELDFKNFLLECLQNQIGIIFKRWSNEFGSFEVFNKINISDGISKDHYLLKKHNTVSVFQNDLLCSELKSSNFIEDLELYFGNEIETILANPSLFFQYHFQRYTASRREAPIYWPIATKSNSFIVWIYYPALNENTLFKIVNELVEPKLEDVRKQVATLEMSRASKDLHEQMTLRDELIDFKEELLRVAQLPYKPNQDDGVLITAAPLHNLFRHTKWRKSTEACWKSLQKGDYDWAHLAYSIWPDRVTNKCKKDLSLAIAHGLESICEITPKEKKTRKKPEIKVETQNKLI